MSPEGALVTTHYRTKYDLPGEVYYPESDGQPMGETDTHWDATADLAYTLKDRYRDATDVYVASDNLVHYEEGNPSAVISPDVYVVFGVANGQRRTYKLWKEGGNAPAAVFEVTSRGTWIEDKGNKMAVCAMLGVREYYLYDPELDYLEPPLQGYRLVGDRYERMAPDAAGALCSDALGLTLHLDGALLVVAVEHERTRATLLCVGASDLGTRVPNWLSHRSFPPLSTPVSADRAMAVRGARASARTRVRPV